MRDFVAWIDQQLASVDANSPDRLDELCEAVVEPLSNVYGIADKVLAIALSPGVMASGKRRAYLVRGRRKPDRRRYARAVDFPASDRNPSAIFSGSSLR